MTDITEIEVYEATVIAGRKAIKSELNAGRNITKFIRSIKDYDQGTIENIINDCVADLSREDLAIMDKRFMTASKRELEFTFGTKWDKDEQRGFFKIPATRNRKSDSLERAYKAFRKNPEDHDLCVKLLGLVSDLHKQSANEDIDHAVNQ